MQCNEKNGSKLTKGDSKQDEGTITGGKVVGDKINVVNSKQNL